MDGNLFIVAAYIPDITSKYFDDSIFDELFSDILQFGKENTPIGYIGDFNGRIGDLDDNYYEDSDQINQHIPTPNTFSDIQKRNNCDQVHNSHGEKIIKFCKTYDFKVLNGRIKGDAIGNFTHLNANSGTSTIDYALCNQYLYPSVETFIILPINELSDHSKLTTVFKGNLSPESSVDKYKWNKLKSRFKWDELNKEKFLNGLRTSENEIEEISQRIDAGLIESTGKMIQDLYYNVAKKSLKQKVTKCQKKWKKRKKSKKWFDKDCCDLKKDLRRVGREKHAKPSVSILRTRYHEKLKEFKKMCRSKRRQFWDKTLEEVENSLRDSNTFWKNWKNATEAITPSGTPDIEGKRWYSHFSDLHREKDKKQLEKSEHIQKDKQNEVEINLAFTRKEFNTVIKNLKNAKAEGADSILNEMIKHSPKTILDLLFRFLNLCLCKSLIPHSWCLELLNPIHKEGNKRDPNNYRGICISSALLKILCCLMNNRIQSQCNEKNLINKNQTGFKKNHRTSDNLLALKGVVKKYVTMGKNKLYTCFVDFKKAYDSVWHEGLFYKLEKNGFSGKLLELIKDIYKKTKCAVKINDRITSYFDYTRGVRQGCPLSPILFNLYINDLFEKLNVGNDKDIFLKEGEPINGLMYADDLILISESKEGLQRQLDRLSEYCMKWKLETNIKKTKVMIFNRGNNLIKTEFTINDTKLENVKSMKYLGFTISAKNCSFLPTIENLSLKAGRAIYALNTKIKLSKIPIRLARKIFDSQIKPILLYGSEVWGPYTGFDYDTWDRNRIEMTHTQFLKRCLGCNYQTSNVMARGEVGARPLLLDVIKKVISYISNIKGRTQTIAYSAYEFESQNDTTPNFCTYINQFNLGDQDIYETQKSKLTNICLNNYDRRWVIYIRDSPKAISYGSFKITVSLEKYLYKVRNTKYRIALSRFRLSNHNLLVEKGRHMRPRLDRSERKCFLCKDMVEDEKHFITKCPLYSKERTILYKTLQSNSIHFNSLSTDEQKFIFIMTNEEPKVLNNLGRYICKSLLIREKLILYFFT